MDLPLRQQPSAASVSLLTAIKIGDTEFYVDVSRIPYLSSFVAFERKARPDATTFVHGPIAHFTIALKGVESGFRHCFRNMPTDLSQYHELCKTYEFLGVHEPGGSSLGDVFEELKAGKSDYELEYKRYTKIKGDKSKARDAAFKLLFMLLLGEFSNQVKDGAKIFNSVLFIVSHSATFKRRTRVIVRMAYEERFMVTKKQKAILNKWVKDGEGGTEEDATTEDDCDEFYNSDSDF